MTHLVVGGVALVLGVCGIVVWWDDFGEFLRGFVPILLVLLGLAALGAGLKDQSDEAESEGPPAQNDTSADGPPEDSS